MKRHFLFLIAGMLSFSSIAFAQSRRGPRPQPRVDNRTGYLVDHGIAKGLITVEYNSWFEKLVVTDTATAVQQESHAEYYGFGLNYERNIYYPDWGWGLGGGLAMGTAVGGDKTGALQYFQARVPWTSARVVPRIFYRWNPQTDLGIDVVTLYKTVTWPDTTGQRMIRSGSEIVAGAFVDLRVRFNIRLEMLQSFGMLYKDESIYWRLGLGYRL